MDKAKKCGECTFWAGPTNTGWGRCKKASSVHHTKYLLASRPGCLVGRCSACFDPDCGNDDDPNSLLIRWLPELMEALKEQLESDEQRWGEEWRHRLVVGQTRRTFARIRAYFAEWEVGGRFPWLKVIGGAYICWIKLRHPEYGLRPMRTPDYNEAAEEAKTTTPTTETIRTSPLGLVGWTDMAHYPDGPVQILSPRVLD